VTQNTQSEFQWKVHGKHLFIDHCCLGRIIPINILNGAATRVWKRWIEGVLVLPDWQKSYIHNGVGNLGTNIRGSSFKQIGRHSGTVRGYWGVSGFGSRNTFWENKLSKTSKNAILHCTLCFVIIDFMLRWTEPSTCSYRILEDLEQERKKLHLPFILKLVCKEKYKR